MATPFDYLSSRDDADELIQEFGQAVSLVRSVTSGPAWDPGEPVKTAYPTFAARVEFTWKQLQGGDILSTDQRWLVAAGPLTALGITSIAAPDRLSIGGVEIPVISVDPLSPAGTVVMFDCQLRV